MTRKDFDLYVDSFKEKMLSTFQDVDTNRIVGVHILECDWDKAEVCEKDCSIIAKCQKKDLGSLCCRGDGQFVVFFTIPLIFNGGRSTDTFGEFHFSGYTADGVFDKVRFLSFEILTFHGTPTAIQVAYNLDFVRREVLE